MRPEELRGRLAEIDPARDLATEAPTTRSSRTRLERAMQTEPTPVADPPDRRRRTTWLAAAAAAAVVLVAGVAALAGGGDDEDEPVASGPPLELSLGASDTMASCMPASAEILADMPVAFAGTATAVEGETVTLAVDEWFVGGDAATAELQLASGMEALIDGFAVTEGESYLISATNGSVNLCGFSGPDSPELRAMYDEAFGS